jgi:NAD(P)-dependent dehydrogenase (short-subunit alcohol dehydrogenase family)
LVAAGHKPIVLRCDVSEDEQGAAMVDSAVDEFGSTRRSTTLASCFWR